MNSPRRVARTWVNIRNQSNLGFNLMHERNAPNFPLDLAAADVTPVALTAPAVG